MGGMAGDIYGSMAEGVSNACVVVCFMSQKYQESPNCMLEVSWRKGQATPPEAENLENDYISYREMLIQTAGGGKP